MYEPLQAREDRADDLAEETAAMLARFAAARREDAERRREERERDHSVLAAMARAQLAQAKRRGYRDAQTRYDPSEKGDD